MTISLEAVTYWGDTQHTSPSEKIIPEKFTREEIV